MSFQLVPLISGTVPIIALQRPVLLIGRHLECDARIDSPKVSRRHCCVAIAYDRVLVRDLGSRNKVRVNGQVVEEARLQEGDELAIGPILYRLELIPEKGGTSGLLPARATPVPRTSPAGSPPGGSPPSDPNPLFPAPDPDSDLIPLDEL
jgi:pSer/pThr/pTyr-binding forkhead associated (FHA) protein